MADGFLAGLRDAARDQRPFDPRTGLPDAGTTEGERVTWYKYARAYTEAKWPNLAPVSRRSVAKALVTVTVALKTKEPGAPEPKVLRRALFAWAFNPPTRDSGPPPESPPPSAGPPVPPSRSAGWRTRRPPRLPFGACTRTLTGMAAAGSTQRRKRSVFSNALGYAVEQGHLVPNPVDRIQWPPGCRGDGGPPARRQPAQAGSLLAVVPGLSNRGEHLEAFYACLYYAALRPSEAVILQEPDLHLPVRGWGRIDLRPPLPTGPGAAGPTTAPPARNTARSTVPPRRPAPSPSRLASPKNCSATADRLLPVLQPATWPHGAQAPMNPDCGACTCGCSGCLPTAALPVTFSLHATSKCYIMRSGALSDLMTVRADKFPLADT